MSAKCPVSIVWVPYYPWLSVALNLHSYNGKIQFIDPHHLPKFWCKKPKATTKVTLHEPPITFLTLEKRWIHHDIDKYIFTEQAKIDFW